MASVFALQSMNLVGQADLEKEFELEVQFENRYFFNEGLYPGQERNFLSLALQPEYSLTWNDGKQSFHAALFFRLNQHDSRRTHFDIRELYYQKVAKKWEWSVGFKKIYWGVTESIHLVDIINQTDQIESFDGEQKLGQPMFHASIPSSKGTFDLFYLPYARKRQFPGESGRLRFPVDLEREDIEIDSELGSWHPGFALRWSHYIGPMDIGISNFYGVGREPLLNINEAGELSAIYPIIYQTGVDFQLTTGPVLWKIEGIYRYAKQQDFTALAAGFEYTFSNIASTGLDIGLLSEYLFDSRDELALSNFDHDLFLGMRLAFNDRQSLEVLTGLVHDLNGKGTFYSMEASRRLGSDWKVTLEGRWFKDIESEQIAFFFREDSFMQFGISKFF
jgi:hypothetical protein